MKNSTPPFESALSKDGYIISQSRSGAIPFGEGQSDISGCGWIAAYNYMRAAGNTPDPYWLSARLAQGSRFKGNGGTGPRRLRRFMAQLGYPMRAAWGKQQAVELTHNAPMGILFYFYSVEPHFVTFIAVPGKPGTFRFLNAVDGAPNLTLTMDKFLRWFAFTPFIYTMVP